VAAVASSKGSLLTVEFPATVAERTFRREGNVLSALGHRQSSERLPSKVASNARSPLVFIKLRQSSFLTSRIFPRVMATRDAFAAVIRIRMSISHNHLERSPTAERLQRNQVMVNCKMPRCPSVPAIMHAEVFNARTLHGTLKRGLDLPAAFTARIVRLAIRSPEHATVAMWKVREFGDKIPMQWHAARMSVLGLGK
jgi:hypothetical protein